MHEHRWEYKVIDVKTDFVLFGSALKAERLTETLNREGVQGWELVNAVQNSLSGLAQIKLFLKRPR